MSHQLTIEPIGQTIPVEDGQTLLDAALRHGIYLPHACCHGLCGTCKVRVLDGEVDHGEASSFALMDFEREEGQCLACCTRLDNDAVIEADIDEDPDAESIPVCDFSGAVEKLIDLTPTIKGVFIQLDQAIRFQAGQYVNLSIPLGDGMARAFSLANAPSSSSEIELNVRIVPGGKGTTWVHESLKPGDRVRLSGPYGRFFVRKSAGLPTIFMAGGSGLSSPKAMILDLLEEGCALPITLIYGQRIREELYCHEEFKALAGRHPNFEYLPVLSHEPEGNAWDGARGFVHEAAQRRFNGNFSGHKAYLCGPPPMIDACITALMRGRLFEKDIYTEKFFSAADVQQARSPLFKRI